MTFDQGGLLAPGARVVGFDPRQVRYFYRSGTSLHIVSSFRWEVCAYKWQADKGYPFFMVGMNPSRNGVEIAFFGRSLLIARIRRNKK